MAPAVIRLIRTIRIRKSLIGSDTMPRITAQPKSTRYRVTSVVATPAKLLATLLETVPT